MRVSLIISATEKLRIASLLIFLITGSLVSETFAVSLGSYEIEQPCFIGEDNKSEGESANNVNNRGCKKVESGYEDSEIEINSNGYCKKFGLTLIYSYLKVYSPLDLGDEYCLPSKFGKRGFEIYNPSFSNDYHILYHRLVFYEPIS